MTEGRNLGPVIASAVASGGAAAWLLTFVEESRCQRDHLAWLTFIALSLTVVPLLVAVVTRTAWWIGLLSTGTVLLVLLAIFRPGGVYDCLRISG